MVICHNKPYKLILAMLRLKCLKSGDCSGNGICFNRSLLIP
ncbi:MAG: hypothetical protein ACTS73_08360 [Arsenophonus sp. NEOnobi-MAG3]